MDRAFSQATIGQEHAVLYGQWESVEGDTSCHDSHPLCRSRNVYKAVQQAQESAPGCQHPRHTLVLVYSGPDKAPLKLLDLVEQGRLQKGSHTLPWPLALLHEEHLR